MTETLVEITHQGGVATLSLNRAARRNAIDRGLLEALEAALAGVRDDPAVRVVVLRGNGPMFSSGIDHTLLMDVMQKSQDVPFRHLHGDLHRLLDTMVRMEKPIIAAMHGVCIGMGFELVLAADFRVVTADCLVGLPEVAFGILPDVGGTTRLTRLVGAHRAKEWILTGALRKAGAVAEQGVFTRVVPSADALGEAVAELAQALVRHPAAAVGLGKILIDQAADVPAATALRLEGVYQSVLLQRPELAEQFGEALAFIKSELDRGRV